MASSSVSRAVRGSVAPPPPAVRGVVGTDEGGSEGDASGTVSVSRAGGCAGSRTGVRGCTLAPKAGPWAAEGPMAVWSGGWSGGWSGDDGSVYSRGDSVRRGVARWDFVSIGGLGCQWPEGKLGFESTGCPGVMVAEIAWWVRCWTSCQELELVQGPLGLTNAEMPR